MTRESIAIAGLGEFVYDLNLYAAQMERGKPELVAEVIERAPEWKRTMVRGLRKNQLAAIVADWDSGNAGPNDALAGPDTPMSELANRDDQPSGDDHLSAQDHRDGCECESCEEFYTEDPYEPMTEQDFEDWYEAHEQDFALGDVPELEYVREVEATHDTDADAELLSFMRTVVAIPGLPDEFPITETDVSAAEVPLVVQSGKELLWGKLISVVNRRTRFLPAFLVVVEFPDGIRRMVRADHTLAA